MLYFLNTFLPRLFLLLLLYSAAGCQSESKSVPFAYNNYKFNPKVMERLPDYDSLVSAILEKFDVFQTDISKKDAYKSSRYMPGSFEEGVFNKLLMEAGTRIDQYFTKLGKDLIYGFDVFRDSTIKIYIRSYPLEKTSIDIDENLSHYPAGARMQKREYPVKDTILNNHWQYWVRFDKQGLF